MPETLLLVVCGVLAVCAILALVAVMLAMRVVRDVCRDAMEQVLAASDLPAAIWVKEQREARAETRREKALRRVADKPKPAERKVIA